MMTISEACVRRSYTQDVVQRKPTAFQLASEFALAHKKENVAVLSGPGETVILADSTVQHVPRHVYSQFLKWTALGFFGVAICTVASLATAGYLLFCVFNVSIAKFATAILTVEAVFFVWYQCQHVKELNEQPQPHQPATLDGVLCFRRLLAHARFYSSTGMPVDFKDYISKWFKGNDISSIHVDNLEEMLSYGFFYKTRWQMDQEGKLPIVKEMARLLCHEAAPPHKKRKYLPKHIQDQISSAAAGRSLSDMFQGVADAAELDVDVEGTVEIHRGYTPGVDFMAHLWERLRINHRPLLFYLITEALHACVWGSLTALGLKTFEVDGTTFYHSPGTQVSFLGPSKAPLLLLHGVGLGLLPYLLLVTRLVASGSPFCAPHIRHVSMRLCADIPTACTMAKRTTKAIDKLGWKSAAVIAHSYGTFVASCMAQRHKERVSSLVLIDPVCFGMFLPSLLYNFVYRTCWRVFKEHGLYAMFRSMFLYLVSRDVHLAATFCRRFYWTDVNLWAEEVPSRSLVVLAGADELLHAAEVREVLTGGYTGVQRRADGQPMGLDDLLQDWQPVMEHLQRASLSECMNDTSSSACGPDTVPGADQSVRPLPFGASSAVVTKSTSIMTDYHGHTDTVSKTRSQVRVLYSPGFGHADFLLRSRWQAEVVEQILSLAAGEATQQLVARRKTTIFNPAPSTQLHQPCAAAAMQFPRLPVSLPAGQQHGHAGNAAATPSASSVLRRATHAAGSMRTLNSDSHHNKIINVASRVQTTASTVSTTQRQAFLKQKPAHTSSSNRLTEATPSKALSAQKPGVSNANGIRQRRGVTCLDPHALHQAVAAACASLPSRVPSTPTNNLLLPCQGSSHMNKPAQRTATMAARKATYRVLPCILDDDMEGLCGSVGFGSGLGLERNSSDGLDSDGMEDVAAALRMMIHAAPAGHHQQEGLVA